MFEISVSPRVGIVGRHKAFLIRTRSDIQGDSGRSNPGIDRSTGIHIPHSNDIMSDVTHVHKIHLVPWCGAVRW